MDSREYWRKREEENLIRNLKTEAEYIKAINGYYDYMLDQIQKEINGFYTKYAKAEGITLAESKRKVSNLDIEAYGRKAARYVKEKNFSKEANDEMRLYNATMKINRLELLKANIGLELVDGFDRIQKYFEEILTERTLSEFEHQAGILGETIHNNALTAHAIVNASFSNASYSDRIWMYQGMMKAELSKLLQTGLIQGRNPRQLATHLQKLFDVRKSDAERLMRTELARVQTEAQKQSYARNGYDQYVFIALGTACKDCADMDNGKPINIADMMPGTNAPPMHPNCRCSTAAYMDREEFERWLKEKEKLKLSDTTDKWAKDARKELRKDEESLARRSKENAVVYDSEGKYLFTKRGTTKEIEFTKSEGRRMKDGIVTHNHPSGASFSMQDINLMRITRMAELRVVVPDGVYYMRAPQTWPERIKRESDLIAELKSIRTETRKSYQKMFEDGKINEIERFWLSSDERNRIFAEKFGFEYGKERF